MVRDAESSSSGENRGAESGVQPHQPQSRQRYRRLPVMSVRHASHLDFVREKWTLSDLQRGQCCMCRFSLRAGRHSSSGTGLPGGIRPLEKNVKPALVYDFEAAGMEVQARTPSRSNAILRGKLFTWRRATRLDNSRERTFDSAGVEQDLALCQGPPRVLRIALEQLAVVREHALADLIGR